MANENNNIQAEGEIKAQAADQAANLEAEEAARAAAEKEQMDLALEYLALVPKFNIGALFVPPFWGPAHGWWPAVLFYPVWLFCDNVFYAAYSAPNTMTVVIAIAMFAIITAFTFAWSFACQFHGVQRAIERGISKEQYAKTQKIWAVVGVIVGVAALALATYFNVVVRGGLA